MKGIMIMGFNDQSEPNTDTQFPVNICEFLKVSPQHLKDLTDAHMKKKMEPNYIVMQLNSEINVASFYSGDSIRHYVGKPRFTITVFLSDDDNLSNDFEGMVRRIAYELLPKRTALNFDDILGKYYDMLKNEELTPFWEEIIEGKLSTIPIPQRLEENKRDISEIIDDVENAEQDEIINTNLTIELELQERILDLEGLLEEKKNKIRELTNKFTEVNTEKQAYSEELQILKKDVGEQHSKLEEWSQQMADLKDINATLLNESRELNDKVSVLEKELETKNKAIEESYQKLKSLEEIEEEAENMLQEKEDLNIEIERLRKEVWALKKETEKLTNQNSIHMDTITNLKIDAKDLRSKIQSDEKDKESLENVTFDLKKEIKILRRERDHYKEIIKEHNLL